MECHVSKNKGTECGRELGGATSYCIPGDKAQEKTHGRAKGEITISKRAAAMQEKQKSFSSQGSWKKQALCPLLFSFKKISLAECSEVGWELPYTPLSGAVWGLTGRGARVCALSIVEG